MTPGPAYDREGVRRFVEALRARHGLTDPEPVTTRPRPAQPPLVAADGASKTALPDHTAALED